MVLTKFKNLLLPNKYSVNSLIKSTVINRSDNMNQQLTCMRLAYLANFKYSRTITQGQQIMLSNLLVHNSEVTYNEVPHLIYHTLEQKSRLQIIPDENIFNIHHHKYGDFVNVNTEMAIEAKTWGYLSNENLDDVKKQYSNNKRNDKFIFSLFYNKIKNIPELSAVEYLANELKLESNQVVIKSIESLFDHFTDQNIDQAITYYNIAWAEYQIENNERLLRYLNELIENSNYLNSKQLRAISKYKEVLLNIKMNKLVTKNQKKIYPYKNNQLLLEDNNHIDTIENVELTPEDIMFDQRVIDFYPEEKTDK